MRSFAVILLCLFAGTIYRAYAQETIPWKKYTIDNSLYGADGARLADADGDGYTDIVTGWEQSGLVRIYFNPGENHITGRWQFVTAGTAPDVEDAVLTDLDGDGIQDVVSCSEGNTMRINVHWGPPSNKDYYDSSNWETAVLPASAGKFQWMFAVPADIDGKNGIDIVAGGKWDNDTYPQPFIGWFRSPENPRDLDKWEWVPLAKVSWVMSVFVTDMNNDGLADIVYTDRKTIPREARWLENPGGDLRPPDQLWKNHAIGDTTKVVLFMDIDDLDNDGRQDVVVATEDDQIHFYRKLADNGLQWATLRIQYPEEVGLRGKGIQVADIDQDGKKDLIVSFEKAEGNRSGVVWLRYKQTAFDTVWDRNEVSGPEGIKFDLVPVHDLDGDGLPDIITTEENNNARNEQKGLGVVWYKNPNTKKK